MCVAMVPSMQRGGLLCCRLSSSSVQSDSIIDGAASQRLLGSGLLCSWDVAVHGEEETVVQLAKRARTPPLAAPPAGVAVLVGGDGGGVSHSIDLAGNLSSKRGHHGRWHTWVS
jgi:hypothetical protein